MSRAGRGRPEIDFTEFVAQRSAALFRTAYVLTADAHVAEELVQEALVRACRRWRRLCRTESPEAYVRRIVVNLANDRWRSFRRLVGIASDSGGVDRPDPRDAYRTVDLRDELVWALQQLPLGMRTVVVLHYLHDLSDEEIAHTVGTSASTVRSQLARGLAKLRTNLGASAAPRAPLPVPADSEGAR